LKDDMTIESVGKHLSLLDDISQQVLPMFLTLYAFFFIYFTTELNRYIFSDCTDNWLCTQWRTPDFILGVYLNFIES